MKNINSTCILAIAPSTRGFGFAVMEGDTLIDWGVKSVQGDKNPGSIMKIRELMDQYQPSVVVSPDALARDSRRAPRIRELVKQTITLARSHNIKVVLSTRGQVMKSFFANGKGTKYVVARVLAEQFPDELADRLPPKRRPWMSEDYRMDIFEAVALGSSLSRRIIE